MQNFALKKQEIKDDEIPILNEACVYKRGEYWDFVYGLRKKTNTHVTA